MHLVVPTHPSLFWVVCHPSRTFPPKEFEREPQNRPSLLPHHQTIQFFTFDLWPTTPVLARYRLVVPRPCVYSTSVYIQSLSVAHAFAMDWRLAYSFYYSFLTSYGVNCFLTLPSSWLAPSKGWALLDRGLFSLLVHYLFLLLACQCSYHAILSFLLRCYLTRAYWVFFKPIICPSYNDPVFLLGSYSCHFGAFFDPLHCLWAPLAHFFLLGHPWPIFFPSASSTYYQVYIPMGFY